MSTQLSNQPLVGITVVNTRPRGQAATLTEELRTIGARVLEFPLVQIVSEPAEVFESLRRELDERTAPDWLVFTSANGVNAFRAAMAERPGVEWGSLVGETRVATVGDETARVATEAGLSVDFVSNVSNSDAFAREFSGVLEEEVSEQRRPLSVLLLRGKKANAVLPDVITKLRGVRVQTLAIYDAVIPKYAPSDIAELSGVIRSDTEQTIFVITSSESAKNLCQILSEEGGEGTWRETWPALRSTPVVTIGPVTEKTLRELGFYHITVAPETSAQGLKDAITHLAPRIVQREV